MHFCLKNQNFDILVHYAFCQINLGFELLQLKVINMSFSKQRVKSANAVSQADKPQKKRRYERLVTQSSQQFHKQPQSKIRSYSRDSSKKGKLNHMTIIQTKQPEQIAEENLNLKVFINDLKYQLDAQRNRLQMNKRKTQKYVKQFNRQFDKEIYYSGKNPNSYMFSGIKQQYQKMKQLYEEKCQEVERYAQSVDVTNSLQIGVYIETLEQQNKLLTEQLNEIYSNKRDSRKFKLTKSQKQHKYSQIDKIYTQNPDDDSEIYQKGQKSREEIYVHKNQDSTVNAYKQKCKQYQRQISQLKNKIKFLDQLIIQKGNNQYQANKQKKKVIKQKHQLTLQVKFLNEVIAQNERSNMKKLNSIIEIQAKKNDIQINILKKQLNQKNEHIGKLQKQIRFLSTMLSYWKPLDQLNRHDFLGNRQPSQNQQFAQSIKIKGNELRKSSVASDHIMPSQLLQPNSIQNEHDRTIRSNRQQEAIRKVSGVRSQSQQNVVNISKESKERIPQSCAIKSKSTSKKCRKIEARQVRQLGELIRYRLIGNNFSVERLKQLFDLSEPFLGQQRQFRLQYISMREIKQILLQKPFDLSEDQAVLVSRYIVQDEVSQFVYWDEDNQIKRAIAKSIIKSLVGDYSIQNYSEIESGWLKLKALYLSNIESALKVLAPKGYISDSKFIELLIGLGIELKDEIKDYIIAKMVIESSSLRQLNYLNIISK